MEMRTLEHCTPEQLTEVFNHAFSDYIVPLKLTNEAMAEKMKTENILPELSAGAFENEQLVGFVLHGYDLIDDAPTVYNAGTGVIPSFRGKRITESVYHFILPKLRSRGIHHHVLEVISTNKPAISIYEKLGFKKERDLGIYKKPGSFSFNSRFEIRETALDETSLRVFNTCQPSWQNNTSSILRNSEGHQFIAAFHENQVVGCAVYVEATGRVKQIAVDPQHRRKGIGSALVGYMMDHKKGDVLVLTNIDLGCEDAVRFLESLGFEKSLIQLEMKMTLA